MIEILFAQRRSLRSVTHAFQKRGHMAEKLTTEMREAAIRARAYQHWLVEGRPDSRHLEHWLKAEKELEESWERQKTERSNNGEAETDALQKVERHRISQVDGGNDASADGKQKQVGGASPKTLKLFKSAIA